MRGSAATRSLLVKAFRVLLVFSLVFWSSFRIELALADDQPASPPTSSETENGGTEPPEPSEEAPSPGEPDEPGSGSESAPPPDPETPQEGSQGSTTPDSLFKGLSIHLVEANPADKEKPLAYVGELVARFGDEQQALKPAIDTVQGELKFVPVIEKVDGERIDASGLVEWSVEEEFLDIADFVELDKKKTGTLKAKGTGDAEIVAVCKLTPDARAQLNLKPDDKVEVKFKVDVIEQAGAYVEAIELLDQDGNACTGAETLKLDLKDGAELSYQFSAVLTIRDPAPNANPATHTVSTADAGGLSEHDKMLLDSLEWSVSDKEGASIDKTGLFKTSVKLETAVMCASAKGHGGASVSASVTVNTGVDVDVQGASHPQDTLLVIVPAEVVKAEPADGEDGGAVEGDGRSGASVDAATTADASRDASQGESASSPRIQSDEAGSSDESASPEAPGPDDAANPADADADKPEPVNKAYSLDELRALSWAMETYTLQGRTPGASPETGADANTTTITGAGPQILALLQDAGADLDKVRSVTFVNYLGETVTLPWSQLSSADGAAMLAASSVVHVIGPDGKDTQDGRLSEADLLGNTRFRVLPGNGASLDSALPWVNTVRVNGEGEGDGGDTPADSSFKAVIGYVPVAMGNTAILSASVVGLYQGEQFGYEWQESSDGGVTWTDTGDTAQTLRVPTSEATIGRMYRVKASTNNDRTATSEPVTIKEHTGFTVSLAFDPPIAGGMAIFTTSVTGISPADITDYIWEWTEDGGETWREIAGSRGKPTFSTKTDPVEDTPAADDGAEGDESTGEGDESGEAADKDDESSEGAAEKEIDTTPAPAIWIHVRALATEGREAVSNPVMLTVHVADEEGSGQPASETSEDVPTDPSTPGSDDPTPVEPEPAEPDTPLPVMHEVDSITMETAPRGTEPAGVVTSEPPATEQTPDGTASTPTPESAGLVEVPTELVVNPSVTAEILEQREAANAVIQATRPGARWTEIRAVDPDGKDIANVLSGNPFAPFTVPFALGITAAGAVEKLLGFRRQTK